MTTELRQLAYGYIIDVNALRRFCKISPGRSRQPILVQRRLECRSLIRLLEDAIQHAAAELRREEAAEPRLNRNISGKTPVISVILLPNLLRAAHKVLACGIGEFV